MAIAPSQYIETSGTTRTRQAEKLTFPFAARPQTMTFYVRFVERGSIGAGDNIKLLVLGSTGKGTFQVDVDADPYQSYRIGASNASANSAVTFSSGSAPSVGDLVEVVGKWNADGGVAGELSINNATPSTTSNSAARARVAAFSVNTLTVNSYGADLYGLAAVRDILVVRGVHNMATMRARLGLT